MKIIDAHTHIEPMWTMKPEILKTVRLGWSDEQYEFVFRVLRDPKLLLDLMDRDDIEKVCIIQHVSPDVMGFTDETNEYAAQYARECPERILPIGSVNPRFCDDPAGRMEHLVSDLGIRGLKIHPPHQLIYPNAYRDGFRTLEVLYEKACDYDIPVTIHTGTSIFPGARIKFGDPIYLDDVATDFPRLKIVMAHGGRPLWMDTAFFLLRKHKNLHLDLAGVPPKNLLTYFPRIEEIKERTLFGSDWPSPLIKSMKGNADAILELPISDSAKRMILHDTAAQLYG